MDKYISAADFFPLLEEQLAQGKRASFIVTGTSMTPWIINRRDSVELVSADKKHLKKGDIILFCPFSGKYVLHRITDVKPCGYITTGDGNCHRDGLVLPENVVAKVVTIHRKGRTIQCSSLWWKIISRIWMALFPLRKMLLKLLGFVGKLRHILSKENSLH